MNGWATKVAVVVVAGGILAGVSGLVVAGATKADVNSLKDAQPGIEMRLGAVEQQVAGLKAATDERAERDEEFRTEQRQQLRAIDGKLTSLLEGSQ